MTDGVFGRFSTVRCGFNQIEPAEVFERYEKAGFLYPAKKERLSPVLSRVLAHWQSAYRAGEQVKWVAWCEDAAGAWASVGAWRTTHDSWNSQHLVSSGGLTTARAVLLAVTTRRMAHHPEDVSQQSWFQPSNRFAQGLFGTVPEALGHELATVERFALYSLPPSGGTSRSGRVRVVPCRPGEGEALFELVADVHGSVYAQSEELDHPDVELDALDQLYGSVGLRRYRRLWLAYLPPSTRPAAAVMAYRGPLGFNFSFLENRCQLVLAPSLADEQLDLVVRALLDAARPIYEDLPLPGIPVVLPHRAAPVLAGLGASFVREYAHSVWLSSANHRWFRHVERFYDRIVELREQRGGDEANVGSVERGGGRAL